MRFKSLKLSNWQQFENIDIDFHEKVTILTGANGSGKTRILANILARHCQLPVTMIPTPKADLVDLNSNVQNNSRINIGSLKYEDGSFVDLEVCENNETPYQVIMHKMQNISCFFVSSHRPIFLHKPARFFSFEEKTKKDAYEQYNRSCTKLYEINNHNSDPVSFSIKTNLIEWGIKGYGSYDDENKPVMKKQPKNIEYFKGFEDILKIVLPETLGFEKFEIRDNEIIFICHGEKEEFVLEQVSGGISSLINIAWQLYNYPNQKGFTVLIDEIENHLHPVMQRQVLPSLVKAFPAASFIVTTHSPLVVNSVEDSNMYVLKYNENRKIVSEKIDLVNQARTATEILHGVLGVSFTMPIWVEKKLDDILAKYSKKEMSPSEFLNMRGDLKNIGLERLMPEAISNIIVRNDD